MIIGADYSPEYQPKFDLKAVLAVGINFIAVKLSDGQKAMELYDSGVDVLREARSYGVPAVGYHMIRPTTPGFVATGNCTAKQQAEVFADRLKAAGVPGMLDLEIQGSTIEDFREIQLGVSEAGERLAFSYIPQWFHNTLGAPSLRGAPALWASHYVKATGSPRELLAQVPSTWWAGHGGLTTTVLQYAGDQKVAGMNIDLNAYQGTVGGLLRYLRQ